MTTFLPLRLDDEPRTTRVSRYLLAGAVLGLLAALITTFVLALADGSARGMTPGSCVLYGCTITMLLSQPLGMTGMIAGGVVGGVVGAATGVRRHGRG